MLCHARRNLSKDDVHEPVRMEDFEQVGSLHRVYLVQKEDTHCCMSETQHENLHVDLCSN